MCIWISHCNCYITSLLYYSSKVSWYYPCLFKSMRANVAHVCDVAKTLWQYHVSGEYNYIKSVKRKAEPNCFFFRFDREYHVSVSIIASSSCPWGWMVTLPGWHRTSCSDRCSIGAGLQESVWAAQCLEAEAELQVQDSSRCYAGFGFGGCSIEAGREPTKGRAYQVEAGVQHCRSAPA